ncbi:hypothetical protein [Micromonospora sp. NPDC049497]
MPAGKLFPDVTVRKPGAPRGRMWATPPDVALVVEVDPSAWPR